MSRFAQEDGTPSSGGIIIVAMPITEGKVAPLFDVAKHLLVVEYPRGQEIRRTKVHVGRGTLLSRLRILSGNGVDVLICEAVSTPLEILVAAEGIKVIHPICGRVDAVLEAYVAGRLTEDTFVMPGCGGRRRRSFADATGVQVQGGKKKGTTGKPKPLHVRQVQSERKAAWQIQVGRYRFGNDSGRSPWEEPSSDSARPSTS